MNEKIILFFSSYVAISLYSMTIFVPIVQWCVLKIFNFIDNSIYGVAGNTRKIYFISMTRSMVFSVTSFFFSFCHVQETQEIAFCGLSYSQLIYRKSMKCWYESEFSGFSSIAEIEFCKVSFKYKYSYLFDSIHETFFVGVSKNIRWLGNKIKIKKKPIKIGIDVFGSSLSPIKGK